MRQALYGSGRFDTFPLVEPASVLRKRDSSGQPESLSYLPRYQGIVRIFFTLWATVAAVYRIEVVHLDPLRLVLLGTALEVAVFLFEVPTGVFADTYGRRPSVVTGCMLMGCGFALEGAIPELISVLAAQAVWGVGYTFISGALEAWIPASGLP